MEGRNSVVVQLTTDWTVQGSNPDGSQDFLHASRPALGPTEPPIQRVRTSLQWSKATWAWRRHSLPCSAEVKERVELYSCGHGVCWGESSFLPFPSIYKQAFVADPNTLQTNLNLLKCSLGSVYL